ncbi:MAG: hypothetical protein ACE5R4_00060 [Armatimonadota bacterium]
MMTDASASHFSAGFWRRLMGTSLPRSQLQPLQPVAIEDGKFKVFADTLKPRFSDGAKVGLERRGNRVVLAETAEGVTINNREHYELCLPRSVGQLLPNGDPIYGMVVQSGDQLLLLPIRVEEHAPDVLGPRIIDELRPGSGRAGPGAIVRHIVKGFGYDGWTSDRLRELKDLVCAEPLDYDPLRELESADDWIAWKTRNEILRRPAPGDDVLRQKLMAEVFARQSGNGSWDDCVVATAYGILRALSIGTPAHDRRITKAAQWLLDCPEPLGRPGMWMLTEERREKWDASRRGERDVDWLAFMVHSYTEDEHDLFRGQEQQQVVVSLSRNHHAGCDAMLQPSATAVDALCRCGYADHPRVKAYANSILQLGGMFGYFCACWGILDTDEEVAELRERAPDFNQRTEEHDIALGSLPYGYARDAVDLLVLAGLPQYPGIHRPDLADTNGWVPYDWRDIGVENHFALVGSYWQNADCWAKTNRALSQFPTWSGSIAEFLAAFQCHLYQTSLGEWNQGYPAGILRWIAEATSTTRAREAVEHSRLLRFAKLTLLKSVPWLREHQKADGTWDHEELPRHGEEGRPPGRRLGTYHIVSVLHEFGLLEGLLPRA